MFTGSRDPPFPLCAHTKSVVKTLNYVANPHELSTASQFGTPNGELRISMSPKIIVLRPHCAREGSRPTVCVVVAVHSAECDCDTRSWYK